MRILNKFIFIYLIAIIFFTPVFLKNDIAAEESVEHIAKSTAHGEEVTENTAKNLTEEHGSLQIWPHYGKMVIFAKIIFAFMLFSFIAPLAHFYIKGEKHH